MNINPLVVVVAVAVAVVVIGGLSWLFSPASPEFVAKHNAATERFNNYACSDQADQDAHNVGMCLGVFVIAVCFILIGGFMVLNWLGVL